MSPEAGRKRRAIVRARRRPVTLPQRALRRARGMRIDKVMSRDVQTIERHATLDRAADLMQRRRVGHLLVIEGTAVVGVINADDVRWGQAEGIGRVEDAMEQHVASVDSRSSVQQVARLLLNQRRGGAVAVCDGARLVGILTMRDLIGVLASTSVRPMTDRRTQASTSATADLR